MPHLKVLLLTLLSSSMFALQTEYLFNKNSNWKVGGFGGPMVQLALVDNNLAVYSGGGGAAIINGGFFIGGYGMGLATNHMAEINEPRTQSRYPLSFGHGGLWLGYNFSAQKAVLFSASLKMGSGSIYLDATGPDSEIEYLSSSTLVMLPAAGVELNLISWMRFGVTAGHQYNATSTLPEMVNNLSSPTLQLQFKFGYFATN